MPDQGDRSSSSSGSQQPSIEEMMWQSDEFDPQSEQHYSGDGTWTESRVICALVDATTKSEALAKGAASFANRSDRADPLFSHEKKDTFELAVELKSLPLAIAETGWESHSPIAQLTTEQGQDALEKAVTASGFDDSRSNIYNEWGEKILSESEVRETAENLGESGWFVLGLGLEPTGSGENHEEYIGNHYQVRCPECESMGAKCANIVFESRCSEHIGIWECDNCSESFRGPHPSRPASMNSNAGSGL